MAVGPAALAGGALLRHRPTLPHLPDTPPAADWPLRGRATYTRGGRVRVRVRLLPGVEGHACAARRQGRRARRDDARSGCPCPTASRSRPQACRECTRAAPGRTACATQIAAQLAALEERIGQRLGDPADPLLVSVRSGARRLDARDDGDDPQPRPERRSVQGLASRSGDARFASTPTAASCRCSATSSTGVDGHVFEDALDRAQARAGRRARRRSRRRRPARAARRVPAASTGEGTGERLPAGSRASSCGARSPPCSAPGTRRGRHVYRRARRHLRRPRHGRQHLPDGVRQPRRRARHRRLLLAQPVDRRARALRRVPAERPGRGRRRRHPHARPIARARGAEPAGLRRAVATRCSGSSALPRHAGHRVHGRAGRRSTCCRRAPASARRRRRCASRASWSPRA